MKTISNEDKAKEIANIFFIENVSVENEQVIREMLNKAAFEAMEWKDEQHAQEKQQWIDKACDWLESVNLDYYQIREGVFSKELMDDFRKAMKGE